MKKHVVVRLTVVIGAVSLISMMLIFFLLDYCATTKIQEKAIGDMDVIANDRAQLVETYIQGCCDFVGAYARTTEAREALEKPKDTGALASIRELTKGMAEDQANLEGLYAAKWDTYVLAHNNPDSMDKTFREPDAAKELEEAIRKADAAFCTGIVQSPVTKKMVIPVYAPVKNKAGEMIGFAGAAFFTDGLSERLASVRGQGKAGVDYSLINVVTNTYIFDNNDALVGTECEDEELLDAVKKSNDELNRGSDYSYSNASGQVVSCHYMTNRDWVFVIRDQHHEVFSVIGTVRALLIGSCVVAMLLMVLVVFFSVRAVMHPLRAINRQLVRLKEGDYSVGHKIEKYAKREDEFGRMAQAVNELKDVMGNQYELFREMLRAQTVGTIVMRSQTQEILMINDRALEMMNLAGYQGTVTAMDIRNEFDDDQLEIVDENMRRVQETEGAEVSYEVSVTNGVVRRHIYTSARHVFLSNTDDVIILCMTDLTELEERKKIGESADEGSD